jgi:rubrerythrin
MDIHKVYQYALQREIEGKRFFEENAARLSHAAAVGAFKTLAAAEQKHIEFIQRQMDLLRAHRAPDVSLGVEGEGTGFFSMRAATEALDQTVLEAMVPDLPVLRTAYLIERDFAEFYELAARQAEGAAKETLEILARWERGHERLFKSLHDRAFAEYAQMPWGG